MIKFINLIACLLIVQTAFSQQPLYKKPTAPVESRIKDLLVKMTLEEKILQLNQYTFGLNNNPNNISKEAIGLPAGIGSLIYFSSDPVLRNRLQKKAMDSSRLGIPILFGFDVIHGFRTVYPISLAQACSWNPDLVTQNCAEAAKESKLSGVDWTFSPMIDVARDARWGRVAEGYGEDPYANSVFCVATVKGYQGEKLSNPYSTDPLYWFGHGLSYTTFEYNRAKVSDTTFKANQRISVEVTVKNTGKVTGKETVLWYISDPFASISRPIKELKFFEKKEIKVGESTTYKFDIDPMRDLSFPDGTGKRILEEGTFYVHVGSQKIKIELVK